MSNDRPRFPNTKYLSTVKWGDFKWLKDRTPLFNMKNKPEAMTRLTWLSEGSLEYYLSQFKTPFPPSQKELDLFVEFMHHLGHHDV